MAGKLRKSLVLILSMSVTTHCALPAAALELGRSQGGAPVKQVSIPAIPKLGLALAPTAGIGVPSMTAPASALAQAPIPMLPRAASLHAHTALLSAPGPKAETASASESASVTAVASLENIAARVEKNGAEHALSEGFDANSWTGRASLAAGAFFAQVTPAMASDSSQAAGNDGWGLVALGAAIGGVAALKAFTGRAKPRDEPLM